MLQQNMSLFFYNDFLKETLATFKFRGDYVIAKAFADFVKINLEKLKVDQFVPIPLSEERLYERGFNQAEALINEAGFSSANLLARIHAEKQSKKSRSDRIHLPQVFRMAKETTILAGQSVLLVDDIYTTGSTLRHAAKVLKGAGAVTVCSLTLARG
jgi:competence protein ComFC